MDYRFIGPSGRTSGNNLLTVGNEPTEISGLKSGTIQLIVSAGLTTGAVILEQSNDGVNWDEIKGYDSNNMGSSTPTLIASTSKVYGVEVGCAYIRVRVTTALVGGTIQAIAKFST